MVLHGEIVERCKMVLVPLRERGEEQKAGLLISLVSLFASLASKDAFLKAYPRFAGHFSAFRGHLDRQDPELLEDGVAALYCYLHSSDRAYSESERQEMDAAGGYWCHAGGLSPLLLAAPYIGQETRFVDYGAGNGLQGLLFQYLYPHVRTVQIEVSGPMIEGGKRLQSFMGIPEERVEWIHGNVMDVPPGDFDFIYLYRPLRPEGVQGRIFYENLARGLEAVDHPVTIFSIADCLKDFLGPSFTIFHDDGHLTCFSNGGRNNGNAGS
ncbi:MAG: class I SAM-dependent methyltransferase [bacterium]|nr:class I SAM-dependent methyltransferase [bacterium]